MNCNTNLRPNPLKMMMRDINRTDVAFEICKCLKSQFRLLSRNLNEDDIITIDDLGEKESFVDYLLKFYPLLFLNSLGVKP